MSEEFRCQFRGRNRHPDIVVPRGSGPDGVGAWICSYFEGEVRRGVKFRSGELVQVGWYVVRLQENGSGDLAVFEPRFGSMPVEWWPGASNAYRFFVVQTEVCRQLQIDAMFPSISQCGLISPKFISCAEEFEMDRDPESGNDSGWVFCEKNCERTEGRYCSLYEISVNAVATVPFLALPTGSSVRRDHRYVEVESFGMSVSSRDNEFLKELVESKFFD